MYPSFSFFLFLLSLLVVLMINPYDRYVSDNSSSPDHAPSRTPISFSLKAAPVVSITAASAISTGQENRSPMSCIPFPSTPFLIPSTQTCRDAMYIPCPGDLSTSEQAAHIPSTCSHRRHRSSSGLMSVQQRDPRPLATLNSESRANVGYVDFGKSAAVLSITSSGTVSRVGNNHLGKTLAAARQRRLQQLDRKRNPSMVTKKQAKKASMDAKFLITLHHSITWHIENRSDAKGLSFLSPSDPELPAILTIRKSPSSRITRARRSRRAPCPTNLPISNPKGPDHSSGPQIRSPCEWDADVPGPDSFPDSVRPIHSKSVFAFSSAHSRSGYHDDASDRRCTSYETSRSDREATSLWESHVEEGLSGVQEVPFVSALLMNSFPRSLRHVCFGFRRDFIYGSYPPPRSQRLVVCFILNLRLNDSTSPRPCPKFSFTNLIQSTSFFLFFFIAFLYSSTTFTFASYSSVNLVCLLP